MLDLHSLQSVRLTATQIISEQGIVYPTPAHPNNRLTSDGQYNFPSLLLSHIESGDPETLRQALVPFIKLHETRNGKIVKVPFTAAATLAHGEYNRYYIAACCKYAIDHSKRLEVYRAQTVSVPRQESAALVGTILHRDDIEKLLAEILDQNNPFCSDFCKPNSGISVRLVD